MDDERMQRYSDVIIDHSRFPRHHGNLEHPTHQGKGENPLCGDRVSLMLSVSDDGVIEKAAFESVGCAISTASASLLVSHLCGLSLEEAEKLFEQVRDAVIGGPEAANEEELGELAALAFAGRYPSRVKCATLAWHVLKHAVRRDISIATTE